MSISFNKLIKNIAGKILVGTIVTFSVLGCYRNKNAIVSEPTPSLKTVPSVKPIIALFHGMVSPNDLDSYTNLFKRDLLPDINAEVILLKREGWSSITLSIEQQAKKNLSELGTKMDEAGIARHSPIIGYGDSQGGLVAAKIICLNEENKLNFNFVGLVTRNAPWQGSVALSYLNILYEGFMTSITYGVPGGDLGGLSNEVLPIHGLLDLSSYSPCVKNLHKAPLSIPVLALGGIYKKGRSVFRVLVEDAYPSINNTLYKITPTCINHFSENYMEKPLATYLMGGDQGDVLLSLNSQHGVPKGTDYKIYQYENELVHFHGISNDGYSQAINFMRDKFNTESSRNQQNFS